MKGASSMKLELQVRFSNIDWNLAYGHIYEDSRRKNVSLKMDGHQFQAQFIEELSVKNGLKEFGTQELGKAMRLAEDVLPCNGYIYRTKAISTAFPKGMGGEGFAVP